MIGVTSATSFLSMRRTAVACWDIRALRVLRKNDGWDYDVRPVVNTLR